MRLSDDRKRWLAVCGCTYEALPEKGAAGRIDHRVGRQLKFCWKRSGRPK